MNGPAGSTTFLLMWIGFTALVTVGLFLIFLWGVGARQFENQDRARHLPLWSEIPGSAGENDPQDVPP